MIYYGSNMRFFLAGIVVALFVAGLLLALGTCLMKRKMKKWDKEVSQ